eukprot:1798464-Amphidinium_carterae.3
MKAIMLAKEGEYRMFGSYLIQCFPLNTQQRQVRGSGHYDPSTQLLSKNLIGTLALSPQRELTWVTMRTIIGKTPYPRRAEENRTGERLTYHEVDSKTSEFYLQYNGNEMDIRGNPLYHPRPSVHNQSFHEHLHKVLDNKPGVGDLQYRLVALYNSDMFNEQVVQRWHAIGEIILPRLIDRKVVDQNLSTLSLLCQFMYRVMGTSYMKDISHLGAIGQYGDDGSAFEEGLEQIHVTDFGNRLYASVIRDGSLPDFTELSAKFTEEHKGDVLETRMGLNFLEKEHRLTCEDMGITAIHNAQETLLRVEWFTCRKGLEWSMAYFHDHSIITAIIGMREACANYGLYVGERGTSFWPEMHARRCLGCGKKRSNAKRTHNLTSYPRLFESLKGHLESGCVHEFFQGAKDMKFQNYFNMTDVMRKWWNKRKRAFVVYVSESGHRQWPVGGIWDLEIMACALSGVFSTLIPQLVTRLKNGSVTIHETTQVWSEDYPVVLEHFASLLDPRVPWWTDCEFPIDCDSGLDQHWKQMNNLIAGQMAQYPDAV